MARCLVKHRDFTLLFYLNGTYSFLTNSTEQNRSWEANSHSAAQEIPHLLRNPKVHYRVHKNPPIRGPV